LDLKAQYQTIRDDVRAAVDRVLESQVFILGPEVEALEREVADYSQCRFGIGVSSGTDALLVALMALDVRPGDEVVTSPYSFFATAGSIARLGAKIIFVDIDPQTYNLDANRLADAMTPRTKAIIPVHLYGQMADMAPIMDVSTRRGVPVIEDAAQAIGSEYQGRRAGTIGQMGCFSFFPSKNLGGAGDGGMVATNDAALDKRLKLLRNHGQHPKYYNDAVGGNFRLDAIQAAILRVKLRHLDEWTAARQQNAERYRRLFAEAQIVVADSGGSSLVERPGVTLPVESPGLRHIYNQFVIRAHRRDELVEHLKRRQIGCEIYYPVPLHLQKCFADWGYRAGDYPIAEQAAKQTLAVPIYPELTEAMQAEVVGAVADFYATIGAVR
jgi:dTDP-4-amino-4,6-dideoxygalactose transaminase